MVNYNTSHASSPSTEDMFDQQPPVVSKVTQADIESKTDLEELQTLCDQHVKSMRYHLDKLNWLIKQPTYDEKDEHCKAKCSEQTTNLVETSEMISLIINRQIALKELQNTLSNDASN